MGSAPILSGELSFYVILYDFFPRKKLHNHNQSLINLTPLDYKYEGISKN